MEKKTENEKVVRHADVQAVLPKFADLLYDDWFKRAFGTEKWKRMLLLLLREIIPERDIDSIEYRQTEHINPFAEKADVRIDVECVSRDGTRFVVELQRASQMYFGNRMLYYSTFAVQQQLAKGHANFDFPPAYIIALMNFDFHGRQIGRDIANEMSEYKVTMPSGNGMPISRQNAVNIKDDEYMFRYMLSEVDHPWDILTDRLQLILIEMPRIREKQSKEWTRLQKFLYYLSHMTELDDIPEKDSDEMFRILHNSAKTDTFTPEEQAKYIKDMTTEQDIRNQIEYGRFEGLEEGLAKGRKEGREEGLAEGEAKKTLEMAKKMLEAGIPCGLIMSITGLSEEEILKS